MKVKVKAVKRVKYAGTQYEAGQVFEVQSRQHAAVLVANRKVRPHQGRASKAVTKDKAATPAAGVYQRRDLVADEPQT